MTLTEILDKLVLSGIALSYEVQRNNDGEEDMPRVILHLESDLVYNALNKHNPDLFNESNFEDDDMDGEHTYGYLYYGNSSISSLTEADLTDALLNAYKYIQDTETEIFKECEDGKLTMEEVDLILQWTEKKFKFYDDRANGYIAFALSNCDREEADTLVDRLNAKCERNGEESNWYLGAIGEEYVFVD